MRASLSQASGEFKRYSHGKLFKIFKSSAASCKGRFRGFFAKSKSKLQ
jgi:hypothetical protein